MGGKVAISWSSDLKFSSLMESRTSPPGGRARRPSLHRLERMHQPRNDYLFEDARIRPHSDLPPEGPALRIDPSSLRHVAFVEKQVDVVDRHLGVLYSGKNQHGRHRLAKQSLLDERYLGQDFSHFIHSFPVVENCHERRDLIEKIFAIADQGIRQKIFLKKFIGRR